MRKRTFLIPLLLIMFAACSASDFSSAPRRTQQLESSSPSEPTPVNTDASVPLIILEQELKNCVDNPNCKQEPLGAQVEDLKINSLITAKSDILSVQNIGDAPAVRFTVAGINESDVESVRYTYIKKDSLDNIIVQSEEKPVSTENGYYSIPIHITTLGSGIMTSAPYDKHILSVKIKTASNQQTYTYDIKFILLSSCENPVTLNRSSSIMDSSYYKMDQDLNDFIVDSVELLNILPYAVTVGGSINISNSTIAILSNTKRQQTKSFLPKTGGYPWDQYVMGASTHVEYHQAVAAPTFRVFVVRESGDPEEIAVTEQLGTNSSTLSFSSLTLQGNEKIRMDIGIHVSTNNSVLGAHGQETFFDGNTICDNITTTSKCSCFYYVPDQHSQYPSIYGMFGCGGLMLPLESEYYPDCGTPPIGGCLQKFMDIVYYPQDLLALAGRDHRTDTSYTITSWLKGYENNDELGTSTKTFDTIEVTKGHVNYSSTISYAGYIPGHVD